MKISKVLVIGSGPIKIAEAAEFDYSGSQALKALKEERIKSVLLNPNVATVQTSYRTADRVYMLPISVPFATKVIEKERPDGIMIGFGGESALDLGIDLNRNGTLQKYGVKCLGTQISGVEKALSRERFAETMRKCGIKTPPSVGVRDEESAIEAAERLGYPLIIRASFNLGGRGSAVVWNDAQLVDALSRAFSNSRGNEILIEKYLKGWKEVEYEVVRDMYGNTAVVACIENLDPMGVHTGESVAITPAQTLDNYEYQEMRSKAIEVADAIGLVGECNVQFALDPDSYEYYAIETNPRMSRSSALASKATGYPLAYVSAKLALGHKIYEIENSVSKKTTAMFEPSLDYITIKAPRWDLEKFEGANDSIGSEMKSIGEVMSIGRSFEEAFEKSVRMLDIDEKGLFGRVYHSKLSLKELETLLSNRAPYWQLYLAKAFNMGLTVERANKLTGIDKFFLEKINAIVSNHAQRAPGEVRVKQIDTLAGEFPAGTDYLYTTLAGSEDDVKAKRGKRLLIVGAGVFRIGVSVEFDWGSVSLLDCAKKYFDSVAMINCNPETVSTDWDNVSELYFDEISYDSVYSLYKKMGFSHVATFTAGQKGNDIAESLEKSGADVIGTSGKSVEIAEDRSKFSKLIEKLGINQPQWAYAKSLNEAKRFAEEVGFPVVIRPSHILGGSSIKIARTHEDIERCFADLTSRSRYPAVISRYVEGVEAEMDCASDGKNVIGITSYQIEESGVHSGDSTVITPFYDAKLKQKLESIALELVSELKIKGPFNTQFIIKENEPYVEELNLRASRSMPFSSKSVGINIIDYAVQGIFGRFKWKGFYEPAHKSFAVKTPQFAWGQLIGSYPFLGPDMRSTGESAALGTSIGDALLKSWLGAKPDRIPERAVVVYGKGNMKELRMTAGLLSKMVKVYTLKGADVEGCDSEGPNTIAKMLAAKKVDAVFTDGYMSDVDYRIRRLAADTNVPLVLNGKLGAALADAFKNSKLTYNEMSEYWH